MELQCRCTTLNLLDCVSRVLSRAAGQIPPSSAVWEEREEGGNARGGRRPANWACCLCCAVTLQGQFLSHEQCCCSRQPCHLRGLLTFWGAHPHWQHRLVYRQKRSVCLASNVSLCCSLCTSRSARTPHPHTSILLAAPQCNPNLATPPCLPCIPSVVFSPFPLILPLTFPLSLQRQCLWRL